MGESRAYGTLGKKTHPRRMALAAAGAFLLAFAGSLFLHSRSALHDTDSYYHLAIARAYAENGLVDELPWVRFSLLREGFGDKELLFHVFLAPLAAKLSPLTAGRLGLSLLAALIAAVIAALAVRPLGWWGIAVPFWLFFASTEFAWRAVRLRPELLSLALLLVAVSALGTGRDRLLGFVTFIYTLSYTAFQALLGLVFLSSVFFSWSSRRPVLRPLLYCALGAGLALLLHPHFPKNLEIWLVQNVEFFLRKEALNVGTEIRPNFTDVLLLVNLGWFLGMAALAMSTRRDPELDPGVDRRLADALGIATLAFGGLYLLMSRFSLYFFPFATLWWLYEMRRRGRRVSAWVALPVRGRVPLAFAAAVCLLVSLPEARRQLSNYLERTRLGPSEERLRDREALSAAIPDQARVAADWGPTATLMLWAPQGRYLNVLDPVFMALPHPEAHRRLTSILDGSEPDVPAAAQAFLNSDHLVYRTFGGERLETRMNGDPRVELRHRGVQTLLRFRPAAAPFVLDWRRVPEEVGNPFDPALEPDRWPSYPRPPDPRIRALEGYVNAERLDPEAPCLRFVRELTTPSPRLVEVDLAPYGPTSVWLDGRLLLGLQDELGAVLPRGVRVSLPLLAGRQRLMVLTCEGTTGEHKGFYWLERR